MAASTMNIAVIPGDGIGKEVMPEGLKVLDAVSKRFNLDFSFTHHDFSCVEYYQQHGCMMPANWKELLQPSSAIFFGAVGWPAIVPDHVSLWQSLILFRREFDQYVTRTR